MMKKVAIITARGGSKRIPKKNIKPFLGKPIIAYSIEAALTSELFDEVMVSTDDDEIVTVAKSFGAVVPFIRSSQNSNDYATTSNVLKEVLVAYAKKGKVFDLACCLYPTAPFVTKELLTKAHDILFSKSLDTIFSILPFSFPIQRAVKINNKNRIEMFQPDFLNTRSQDLESAYHDAGQFYWFKTKPFLLSNTLITENSGGVILKELEAHDIDTLEDWDVAEFKFKFLNKSTL